MRRQVPVEVKEQKLRLILEAREEVEDNGEKERTGCCPNIRRQVPVEVKEEQKLRLILEAREEVED
jgi:hypothetical protein